MNKFNFYKASLFLSLVFLIVFLIMALTGNIDKAGPVLMLFFFLLAIGIRVSESTKGLSYTMIIFMAASAAMFYPQYITTVGEFNTSLLIVPLLQIIMFGMGSQMSFDDFAGIIKMPKGVIIGIVAQFSIMPLVAFAISNIFDFPAEIAAGVILIGCVPSGLASTVMSFLARANVALAVTLAAVTTILSPFVTPLLMRTFAGTLVDVKFWVMMLDIMNMIILPIVAGFIFNIFINKTITKRSKIIQLCSFPIVLILTSMVYQQAHGAAFDQVIQYFMRIMMFAYLMPIIAGMLFHKFFKGNKKLMDTILGYISQIGIAIIVAVITAAGRDSLMVVGFALILTSFLHNFAGYSLGYTLATIFRMSKRDCRTIAFEVGMQNGGMASGLALQMGKIATVGLAPAVFGPLMNITGSALANFWRSRPVKEEVTDDATKPPIRGKFVEQLKHDII